MITVSLTTTKERLPYIGPVLDSLSNQSFVPDCILLHLPKDHGGNIPMSVLNKCSIQNIDYDYGPLTKLVAPLKTTFEGIIVTADDDLYYPPHWLEGLVNYIEGLPDTAFGYRGKILDSPTYKESTCTYAKFNQPVDIITGTWGVAYRAEWFDLEELLEWHEYYKPYSLYCDDILINGYLKAKGIYRFCISSEEEFKVLPQSKINALWDFNKDSDYNDILIEKLGL